MRFPREWFGPSDELVRLRTQREGDSEGEERPDVRDLDDLQPPEQETAEDRAVLAQDFWTGAAAVDDLIQFPAQTPDDADDTGGPLPVLRRQSFLRRRLLAASAVFIAVGAVGMTLVHVLVSSGTAHQATAGISLAEAAGPIRALSALSMVAARPLLRAPLPRFPDVPGHMYAARAAHHGRPTGGHSALASNPTAAASSAVASSSTAAVYSGTVQPQQIASITPEQPSGTSLSSSTSTSSSTSASGGSGGGSASGEIASSQSGPVGPGAAFGPGHLGR